MAGENNKQQLIRQHQQLLAKEAQAKDPAEKKKYTQQRVNLEKQISEINLGITAEYSKRVKKYPRPVPYFKNLLWAFCVGGSICAVAQAMSIFFQSRGLDEKMAGAAVTSVIIIVTGVLTGLGIFDEIGRRAGAGTTVPVSGFANSIVSAALEFKNEGLVYGIGAKLFTVAGPVIAYGTMISMIIGVVYWFLG